MTKSLLIALSAVLLLSGCAAVALQDDSRTAEQLIEQAENLVGQKKYAEAAELYRAVTSREPTTGEHYLRLGELLERIDRDRDARKVYKRGLEKIGDDDPDRTEIVHRLALISAHHLYRIEEAEQLLVSLPNDSIERHDLAAFLYYQTGQHETALELLNAALQKVRKADQKALLMYHASLIYHKLEDEKNTFGSLYHAINLSEHLGLIRDIENFWEEINQTPLGSRELPRD
ncbi:MAG: tetratricopeptide repeat protein [Desulfuromonadales bacterium]|nr:tetratricopeptide repeat protein [Desulfuromonadales bacterium]